MESCRILFVDDDRDILVMVEQYLQMQQYDITTVDSGLKALDIVKDRDIDIIFTDYKMPEFNGLELLAAVKQHKPEIEVIMVTGYGSMESAIQAMKYGSYDYLQKPFKLDHLKLIIDRIVEEKKVKDKADLIRKRGRVRHKFHDLVGISPTMQQVYEMIETVGRTNPMVLIQGESGTGKELVARTIHQLSDRRDNAFVPVNCGSITEGIPEEEVLGHVTALMGKVHGGTIYLDEIAELAPSLRLSILQALEADYHQKQSATRVIAATGKELGEVIASGALKKDALDLLNAVVIRMPPLRERMEDLCLLMHHFLYQACTKQKRRVIAVSPDALDILMRYHWPGNLIQVQNVIDRALALGVDDAIQPDDLPAEIQTFSTISKMG
ncbi:sigma-54-dependent transcriptional regulator [Desulfatitalea alkaliphila]|uniref:Sigma-54 dependent transcriptional regulator n=1 Tax=Desulfatitalea alkaliphila TaxID=2929485 RepID=A0AA41R5H2_9BACT|nr:sigma-54 dependent transcriptional regulator [Desulfatitalea alkaliphila]MCJ8501206.1 sigma-54 dependent transcriptional regulator [Desulfatitalea alkaliphila]